MVEVCEICDIADCRHIRARRAGTALDRHIPIFAPQAQLTILVSAEQSEAYKLLKRAHAVMLRCHWNEPTGMDEGKDSALNLEREVREFLGVEE